ncbi:heparan-alpha-glucosaminide N-acetyltransferase domain-containing protein [Trinickia sp. YCB016]
MLAVDALRGFVMLLMLIDHVRETFFLHRQVGDPMDALTVEPSLFFTRMTSQICAPVFVFLTGLSAYLYGQRHTPRETSAFLLKRGVFLVVLEVTFVCFAWTAEFPPKTLWLQVIWCIGVCMIVLAALLHLQRAWQIAFGLAIVAGHNLLDGVAIGPDSAAFVPWSMLHQKVFIEIWDGLRARTTYPVLPWIGVILLGYAIGPWFAKTVAPAVRAKRLVRLGVWMLVGFLVIRYANVYGDMPWVHTGDALRTVMSFFAARKYPPSLMFLMPALGVGVLLLAWFEKQQTRRAIGALATLGGAPMFFYLLHLYVLKALYLAALAMFGANQGQYFGFDSISTVWLCSLLLAVPLFFPVRWFAQLKQRRKDIGWLKYL